MWTLFIERRTYFFSHYLHKPLQCYSYHPQGIPRQWESSSSFNSLFHYKGSSIVMLQSHYFCFHSPLTTSLKHFTSQNMYGRFTQELDNPFPSLSNMQDQRVVLWFCGKHPSHPTNHFRFLYVLRFSFLRSLMRGCGIPFGVCPSTLSILVCGCCFYLPSFLWSVTLFSFLWVTIPVIVLLLLLFLLNKIAIIPRHISINMTLRHRCVCYIGKVSS